MIDKTADSLGVLKLNFNNISRKNLVEMKIIVLAETMTTFKQTYVFQMITLFYNKLLS